MNIRVAEAHNPEAQYGHRATLTCRCADNAK